MRFMVQMELLRDEISFLLNNADIPKDEPFEFLRNLYVAEFIR